jgi:hypothetical protein
MTRNKRKKRKKRDKKDRKNHLFLLFLFFLGREEFEKLSSGKVILKSQWMNIINCRWFSGRQFNRVTNQISIS